MIPIEILKNTLPFIGGDKDQERYRYLYFSTEEGDPHVTLQATMGHCLCTIRYPDLEWKELSTSLKISRSSIREYLDSGGEIDVEIDDDVDSDLLKSMKRFDAEADKGDTDNKPTILNPTYLKRAMATISSLIQIKPKSGSGYVEKVTLTQTRCLAPVILEGIVDRKKNFTRFCYDSDTGSMTEILDAISYLSVKILIMPYRP